MILKYFMRGLGIGIIFGALVMLAASSTPDKEKISDDEVMNRAKKLGMVMATDTDADKDVVADKTTDKEKQTTEDISTTEVTTEATTGETTEATTESTTEETTEKAATEAVTTTEKKTEEKTTEEKKTTEATTEAKNDKTTEALHDEYTEATISVTRGMGSTEVAGLLQKAGIIADADDFDSYLVKQGISNKIQINTFKLNSNMTYEEIAKIITTPKND